ncbi:hypothetical protein [Flavobacterium sp. KJJ]|uniref:hypothetical protein n=1 Tax=Flavobacterium sp. KJJ TaxID=1270193 RepID=UPI0004932208|nr:hypothetical protein [Flavobacterium sp. KJJ]
MEEMITFFGGIAFYFLLDLLKSYYKKKIENEANIEDLPELTKVTEIIQQHFRKELSTINAQLSILTKQSSIIDEKSIQVLNQFFERCLEIRDLHSQSFGDFIGKDLAQVMTEYQISVEIAHRKLYSDYHNLVLFHIKNTDIIENANDIVSSSHLVRQTFKKHFGFIKISLLNEAGYSTNSAYKEAVENSDKVTIEYYADQKPNYDLFNKNFNSLLKSMSKYFSEYGLKFKHEELER